MQVWTKNTKLIAILQILSKTGKQWHNKGSTELYCLYSSWQHCWRHLFYHWRIVLWPINKFQPNPAPDGF